MTVRRPGHGEKTGARWELGDLDIVGSPEQAERDLGNPEQADRDWRQVDEVVRLGRGCGEKIQAR